MIPLYEIITPERTLIDQPDDSLKSLFSRLSEILSNNLKIDQSEEIFEAFLEREKLGSTALGQGVAIPHIRSPLVNKPIGVLLHLKQGIDFGSSDHKLVDIVFAFMVPQHDTDEHLKLLATLAEKFKNSTFLDKLRQAHTNKKLHEIMVS